MPHDDDVESVTVPENVCPLSEEECDALGDYVSPEAYSTNHGLDLFISALTFVENRIAA